MNILITGATGFIGRHLAAALSKTYSVRCLVRKTSDITPLKDLNVDITYGDLLVKDSLAPALDGIDLVYHLAGEVYAKRGADYYNGNILGTNNLLEICKGKNLKKIIYLSSIAVYKPVMDKTLLTEDSEYGPITLYGKTKLAAEKLVRGSDIPFVIIRAPVVYGPHQPPIINKFFLGAVRRKRVYIIGDGENFRSLCFVKNLIDGLLLLIDESEAKGKTYVLSDDTPYTFNQVTEAISKAIDLEIRSVHLPGILGNISWQLYNLMGNLFGLYFVELYGIKTMQLHLGCDITKATEEMGYNPSVSLKAGIGNTVEWIRNCCV
jgi:nucleoside-diphosphate-sugar epimerase